MLRGFAAGWLVILLSSALLPGCARGNTTPETWEPASTGFATEILISTSDDSTSAEVRLICPNSGYRVTDWGHVVRNGSDFSVDVKVQRWTGVSAQMIRTLKQTYALGALAPGTYSFTVKVYGSVAKTQQFSVQTARSNPKLQIEGNTERAIALESVTFTREPYSLVAAHNFSPDGRARLMLFASDLPLAPGGDLSTITAEAADSQGRAYRLPLEYVGKVPNLASLTQLIIKLPAELENAGEIRVSIAVGGIVSNRVLITVKPF
jgi:uncharacterized protein (TIGR03437 family)